MMSNTIKAGIIGCGRVSNWHSRFLTTEVSKLKIIKVCDIKSDLAKATAAIYNAEFCTDYKKILSNDEIDLVVINTLSGLHFKHSYDSLKATKHDIVEKPPTLIPNEFEKLSLLAKENSLLLVPIFQNRFNPTVIALKDLIDNNYLGKIVSVSVNLLWCRYQSYYDDGWHGTWKMDGGVINQQAIHHIDALNWIFGPCIDVVSFNEKRLNKLEAEDTNVSIIRLKNNILATVMATTAVRPDDLDASIRVIGENGYVTLGGIALNKFTEVNINNNNVSDKDFYSKNYEVENGYGYSHKYIFQQSINNLLNNSIVSPIDHKSVTETLKLIHSMYRSDEDYKIIKIKDDLSSNLLGKK